MDTIGLKIRFLKKIKDKEIKRIEQHNFLSVSRAKKNSDQTIIVKVSYPKFIGETNATLVMDRSTVLKCNRAIYNILTELRPEEDLEVKIIRVDIPFTYYMPENMNFSGYKNIFYMMAKIFKSKNDNFLVKSISEFIEGKVETLTFANATTVNNCNSKIIIYNQDKRFKDTYNDRYKYILKKHPDLPRRIRIEVSKRIDRSSMSLYKFAKFDVFNEYKDSYLDYLFENLFDAKKSKKDTLKFGNILREVQNKESEKWIELLEDRTNKKILIAEHYNYKSTLGALQLAIKKVYQKKSSSDTAFQRIKKYVRGYHIINFDCYVDMDKEFRTMAKSLVKYYDFD